MEQRSKLVSVFLSLLGLGIGALFVFNNLGAEADEAVKSAKPPQATINFSVFQREEFQVLEIFEGSTMPEEKGRERPFEIYVPEEEREEEEEVPEESQPEGLMPS